ncbi:MAG: DUF2281 domain-containing protein [Pyrinomonadaceae bacterium]
MIAEQELISKINSLPPGEVAEVIDFVDFLLQKRGKDENGSNQRTQQERADSIEVWAKSHCLEAPVIFDDRREIIYED